MRGDRWLTSREACARLGVKPATLYTYVSRGAIRCAGEGRTRRYHGDDVERAAKRAEARRGHTAVAAGALRWGEAVLDTAITSVGDDGLSYRGRPVDALARERVPFESVADWLWAAPPEERWPVEFSGALRVDRSLPFIERFVDVVTTLGRADSTRDDFEETTERARARTLLRAMASSLAPHTAERDGRLAEIVAKSLGVDVSCAPIVDVALVLSADHELNASSFAARVAASAGADLYGCLGAALQVVKGSRHGGVCDRLEALLARPELDLAALAATGELLPGFGHRLYPGGDPRVAPLFEAIGTRTGPRAARARAYVDEGARLTGEHPAVDLALVVVSASLDLPVGAASALFALGRVAGWVAHVLEQRRAGELLRPRARYTGPRVNPSGRP